MTDIGPVFAGIVCRRIWLFLEKKDKGCGPNLCFVDREYTIQKKLQNKIPLKRKNQNFKNSSLIKTLYKFLQTFKHRLKFCLTVVI